MGGGADPLDFPQFCELGGIGKSLIDIEVSRRACIALPADVYTAPQIRQDQLAVPHMGARKR